MKSLEGAFVSFILMMPGDRVVSQLRTDLVCRFCWYLTCLSDQALCIRYESKKESSIYKNIVLKVFFGKIFLYVKVVSVGIFVVCRVNLFWNVVYS